MWIRRVPEAIPVLEALLRRYSSDDASFAYFEKKLRREKSGFYGEQRLDREWFDFQIHCPYKFEVGNSGCESEQKIPYSI